MTIEELFDRIREHYVGAFSASVRDKVKDRKGWLIEHTFGRPQGSESEEGLDLPMRHDVIPLKGGEPQAVMVIRTETQANFEPFQMRWGGEGKPLTVMPFTWDRCQFVIEGFSDETEWQPLVDWFDGWFDPEDRKKPDARGVRNVVHTVFPPEVDESGEFRLLEVDLGTAPPEALAALLDALVQMGATTLTLGGDLFGEEEDDEEGEDDGDDDEDEDD